MRAGRAGLELIIPTLDYRLAAQFWGITDPRTALLTNAIVGGTPAYRREFTQDDRPDSSQSDVAVQLIDLVRLYHGD